MINHNDERYKHIFSEVLSKSDDGFIVVDRDGIITDINDIYCDFLDKAKEDILGKNIKDVISNTSMIDVMKKGNRGDEKYIHRYVQGDTKDVNNRFALANRFCIFNENSEIIGAVAQLKFRQKTLDFAQRIINEEFVFLQNDYNNDDTKFGNMIGQSPNFIQIKKKGIKASKTAFPVLLTGESGTGKEVFAKAIHMESNRQDSAMISINCAAIPAELLESELFGYEEGAFTGAKKGGKKGKFRLADKGTIFLDEIGDMPLNMQAKLLRALQEKEIEVVGGSKPVPVDIRVIAATRKNLTKMIEDGEFREDLYYRLNVINIEMIPLRERKSDILPLANYFLDKLNKEYDTRIVLTDEVKKCLENYTWPGNIRELDNVIKSAYASCDDFIIERDNLPSKISSKKEKSISLDRENKKLKCLMDEFEAIIIKDALKDCNWSFQDTADKLGIQRTLLYKKVKKLGIEIQKSLV